MKNGDSYPPSSFALLLLGYPGTGKTTTAMGFPRPWFLDMDHNLSSADAVWKHKGMPRAWTYDVLEQTDEGKEVERHNRWLRLDRLTAEICKNPNVDTVVFDSLSELEVVLCDYLINEDKDKVSTVGGEKMMNVPLYRPFYMLIEKLFMRIRSAGKILVVTCHIKQDQNKASGVIEYLPSISGKWKTELARLFSDFWQADVKQTTRTKENPAGVEYFIRTAPTSRLSLKCSVPSLIPDFVFSPEKVSFLTPAPSTQEVKK